MKFETAETFTPSPVILANTVSDLIGWAIRGEIQLDEFEDCYNDLAETQRAGGLPVFALEVTDTPEAIKGTFTFNDIRFFLGSVGSSEVIVLVGDTDQKQAVTISPQTVFNVHVSSQEVVISSYATV